MKVVCLILISLFFSLAAFAMGENKLGPNGGFISMPGAYHVELVDKDKSFDVYLLDMSMKKLTVSDSFVSLKYVGDKIVEVNCRKENDYFVCPRSILKNVKEVVVESRVNKAKGRSSVYKLPLKY